MARRGLTQADIEDAKSEGYDEGAWLVILSDLMMLLLTFFVMLFAITAPSDDSFIGVLREIGDALGGDSLIERKSALEQTSEKIEALIKDNNLVRQINITSDTKGITMFAAGDLFFESGSVKLKPDIKRFLKKIGEIIEETKYKVIIEGHTDDIPIKSDKFPSNWELSTARASAVVRYFTEEGDSEPARFAAVGYAQHKPRFAMIPENRSKNRRVELIILREEF